jgi:hypothetical protein
VPNLLRGISHTLAALTANGGDFRRAWAGAGAGERWMGEWRSEANGHHGALRCVLRPGAEGGFDAMFHARYARCLRVCYGVRLKSMSGGSGHRLEGEADLGALAGGIYKYRGELADEKLICSYECRYDHGVFELKPVKHG